MAGARYGELNLSEYGSRNVNCFENLELIGKGSYGEVFRAKEKETGEIVALKKIRIQNERQGFPITAIREIKILWKLRHENVLRLKEVLRRMSKADQTKTNIWGLYMVFEYMDHDLDGLTMQYADFFTSSQIKCYMQQLLRGLHYCHENKVLHRDIKGPNLLINNEGTLKLADFGLSRFVESEDGLTNNVVTRWYRPPELLLGSTKYGPAVDMWSVGCVFAELLFSGEALFPGKTVADQVRCIYELCGTPDWDNWPGASELPYYDKYRPPATIKRKFSVDLKKTDNPRALELLDPHTVELLDRMLSLDPARRISASNALDAQYFKDYPLPCDPKSLPKYDASHVLQVEKKRRQLQQQEEAAKRQRLQHPHPPHSQLPPGPPVHHSSQDHTLMPPNQPMHGPQPSGPSLSHYGNPRGPNQYHSSSNPSGSGYVHHPNRGNQGGSGYWNAPYPGQGRSVTYPRGGGQDWGW